MFTVVVTMEMEKTMESDSMTYINILNKNMISIGLVSQTGFWLNQDYAIVQ